MADRPILFSAPMVRALLDGRKTQTRRVLKDVPPSPGDDALNPNCQIRHAHSYLDAYCSANRTPLNPRGMSRKWCWWTRDDRQCLPVFDVRFVPGDRLWVKENWLPDPPRNSDAWDDWECSPVEFDGCGLKAASVPLSLRAVEHALHQASWTGTSLRWKPSIHMPRWASRLTLTVTDVRVQRLTDCTEEDALAEGVVKARDGCFIVPGVDHPNKHFGDLSRVTAREMYAALWDAINGSGSWLASPWIVALTFTVERRNIDA